MTPRGAVGWVLKPGLFLAAIVMTAVEATAFIFPESDLAAPQLALITVVTAFPFVMMMFAFVSYLYKLQSRLADLAATDLLTGLPNRRAFLDHVAGAADDLNGVLLMLDVDNFKRINDSYGHAIGDQCLCALAAHIRREIRQGDVVARVGGEEFVVLLVGADERLAIEIGDRLCAGVEIALPALAGVLRVTVSAGATTVGQPPLIDELLRRADEALYRAKRAGKARIVMSGRADVTPFPGRMATR